MLEPVHFKIPTEMRQVASEIARDQDITLGQLIRNLLTAEISRRKNARPPNRADERLVAPLRARLAPLIAAARNWRMLDENLAALGYVLRPAGGGLALHRTSTGERLCKASELGFGYSRLIDRFGAPHPQHSHTWVADRVLAQKHAETEDDIVLIE